MTQTIEQLTARVRELEEETRQLRVIIAEENKDHIEQQSASQAYAEQLREALEAVKAQCIDGHVFDCAVKPPTYWTNMVAKALALPHSTSALDAYVAEKVKESHKVVPREGLVPHAYQLEATHNNAEYWYKWGHSEEMAAKGESVICMAQAVFAWRNAAYAKAEEVESLTRQRDLAVEALEKALQMVGHPDNIEYLQQALSTIKESEGK